MKNILLENLTPEEIKEINGGIGLMAAGAIVTAVLYLIGSCCALSQGKHPHTGSNL